MGNEFKQGDQVVCISDHFPYIPEFGGNGEAIDKPKLREVLIVDEVLGDFLMFKEYNTEHSTNWFFYNRFKKIDGATYTKGENGNVISFGTLDECKGTDQGMSIETFKKLMFGEYQKEVEIYIDKLKRKRENKTLEAIVMENNYKVVKVYVDNVFHRFQRVKQIQNVGDIFILHHSSKFINDKAMVIEKVESGKGFTRVYLKGD